VSEVVERVQAQAAEDRQRREREAAPISVVIPGFGEDGTARRVVMTYAEGKMLEYELVSVLTRHQLSSTSKDAGHGAPPKKEMPA
jgi:hypothetical protein